MKQFAIVVAMIGNCACAQLNYDAILTNMVAALEQPGGTLDSAFTNQLAVHSDGITNVFHAANINLVRAISMVDVAEDDLSGNVLLPQAISICSNLLMSAILPGNAWQRGAAGIVLSATYSFDGMRQDARRVATNAVLLAVQNVSLPEDVCLWNAIAKHLDVEGLSVNDALQCYAAIAILSDDPLYDVCSYTNGLPASVLGRIMEISK